MDKEDIVRQIKVKDKWLRAFFMVVFIAIIGIVKTLLFGIMVFQFGYVLLVNSPNSKLMDFSRGLITYLCQLYEFVTYNSNMKPFPFGDWPEAS